MSSPKRARSSNGSEPVQPLPTPLALGYPSPISYEHLYYAAQSAA
jgi:hypothetical protein